MTMTMSMNMTKSDFLRAFQLSPLMPSTQGYRYPDHKRAGESQIKKDAAVLIALVEEQKLNGDTQLSILLTRRAAHLRHHGGQISFPGGKVEVFDDNIIATALRETEEEIGINKNDIEVIGHLQQYQTISGFTISPIVAFIKKEHRDAYENNDSQTDSDSHANGNFSLYKQALNTGIDKDEVEEVFLVPLSHFLNVNNRHSVTVSFHNQPHEVHFMPYETVNVWGATAAMLKDLAAHLVR